MSLSRKSSFNTIVSEKADHVASTKGHFSLSPEHLKENLDFSTLSKSLSTSFNALRRWQQAQALDSSGLYPVFRTLEKVIGYGDEFHAAIKSSLAAAEKGVALSNTLANLESKSQNFEEFLTKASRIVDKGQGRSMQAHGQLIVAHAGLLTISEGLASHAAFLEERNRTLDDGDLDGISTNFVTIPSKAGYPYSPVSVPNISAYRGIGASADSDDEDDTRGNSTQTAWGAAYNYTTYRTAAAQLGKIASKVAVAVKEAAHCVDWWAEVKANLDDMKSSTFLVGQKIKVDHEQADGWKIIGDKFTLYIYNNTTHVTSYYPGVRPLSGAVAAGPYNIPAHVDTWPGVPASPPPQWQEPIHVVRGRSRSPSPRRYRRRSSYRSRSRSRSRSPAQPEVVVIGQPTPQVKPKSMWKRLSCVSGMDD